MIFGKNEMTNFNNEQDRRRFPRVNAPIYFSYSSRFSPSVPAANVSLGGVRMFADEKIEIGKRLNLTVTLPRGGLIECRGEVVWIKDMPEGSEANYDLGISFVDIAPGDRTALKEYLS